MSDAFDHGVLYTHHAALGAGTPFPSLWSYESSVRGCRSLDLPHQQWLHRSDPLLNTILPSTHVSIVLNFGDRWAAGRSLPGTSQLPSIAVFGPFTEPRLLRVGRHVHAIGVVLPSILARPLLGVPAPDLVNQIVPLDDIWPRDRVNALHEALVDLPVSDGLGILRDVLLARLQMPAAPPTIEAAAVRLLDARRGHVAIDAMAAHYGVSRQRFARRFQDATGVSPKLFARIVRFQGLVYSLLSTDVSDWAAVAPAAGFYDQAHMINEFRGFAGASPTRFFQPHDDTIDPARIQVRGRPSDWLRECPGTEVR